MTKRVVLSRALVELIEDKAEGGDVENYIRREIGLGDRKKYSSIEKDLGVDLESIGPGDRQEFELEDKKDLARVRTAVFKKNKEIEGSKIMSRTYIKEDGNIKLWLFRDR